MHNLTLAGEALWKVALIALVIGAGLPALFAVGVRSLAYGVGGGSTPGRKSPVGTAGAVVCFALVVFFVVSGLMVIITSGYGKDVSFSHIYPTIVEKKK